MSTPKNKPQPIAGARRAAALPADTTDELELSDAELLQRTLDELQGGDGYTIRVERVRAPGMRQELAGYLGAVPLSPELFDDVFQEWGGGKYKGRIYRGNAYNGMLRFEIAGEPRPRESERAALPAPAAAESETAALLKQLIAKLDQQQQPQQSRVQEFAEMAKVMRELIPAPAAPAPASDPVKMFEMFDTMLDLRRRVAEESGERPADNGIVTIVREGVQPMIELVRDKMEMDKEAQRQARGARGVPAATAARPAGASSPSSDPIAKLAARIPGMGRSFLAGAARAKKDPALYAEMVLDQIPGEEYDALPPLLAEPDFTARLLALVPEWQPFPVWFGEMAAAMYRSLTGEIVVEEQPAAADELHAAPAGELHAADQARTA